MNWTMTAAIMALAAVNGDPRPALGTVQDEVRDLIRVVEQVSGLLDDVNDKIDIVADDATEAAADVADLERRLETGGNPKSISAALDTVEDDARDIEDELSSIGVTVDSLRGKLERVADRAGQLKDKSLSAALRDAMTKLGSTETSMSNAKRRIASVFDAIAALRRAIGSAPGTGNGGGGGGLGSGG